MILCAPIFHHYGFSSSHKGNRPRSSPTETINNNADTGAIFSGREVRLPQQQEIPAGSRHAQQQQQQQYRAPRTVPQSPPVGEHHFKPQSDGPYSPQRYKPHDPRARDHERMNSNKIQLREFLTTIKRLLQEARYLHGERRTEELKRVLRFWHEHISVVVAQVTFGRDASFLLNMCHAHSRLLIPSNLCEELQYLITHRASQDGVSDFGIFTALHALARNVSKDASYPKIEELIYWGAAQIDRCFPAIERRSSGRPEEGGTNPERSSLPPTDPDVLLHALEFVLFVRFRANDRDLITRQIRTLFAYLSSAFNNIKVVSIVHCFSLLRVLHSDIPTRDVLRYLKLLISALQTKDRENDLVNSYHIVKIVTSLSHIVFFEDERFWLYILTIVGRFAHERLSQREEDIIYTSLSTRFKQLGNNQLISALVNIFPTKIPSGEKV